MKEASQSLSSLLVLFNELGSFFRASRNAVLRSASMTIKSSDMDITANIGIDFDEKCCELVVYVSKDTTGYYVIDICLEYLRIHRKEGCSSGNEYLDAINIMLDEFFSQTRIFESLPIRRIFFKVGVDVSSLPGFPTVIVTSVMKYVTQVLSMYDGVLRELDLRTLTIGELIDMKGLTVFQKADIVDFYEKVIRIDFPTMYDGSMRVKDFAYLVLGGRGEVEKLIHKLISKLWYCEFVQCFITPEMEMSSYDVDHAITFPRISLGIVTLLTRDDYSTWYMKRLKLSVCSKSLPPDLEARVRAHQNERFVEVVPELFRKYFVSDNRTVRETLMEGINTMRTNRQFTYFDVIPFNFTREECNYYEDIEPYFFYDVCRNIYLRP